ncbi:hypothetical protein F4810DRAFT_680661, partial [Camillea tinctor]
MHVFLISRRELPRLSILQVVISFAAQVGTWDSIRDLTTMFYPIPQSFIAVTQASQYGDDLPVSSFKLICHKQVTIVAELGPTFLSLALVRVVTVVVVVV